jgi:hypothetical protein
VRSDVVVSFVVWKVQHRFECVERLVSIGLVEALDERVVRFLRLDEPGLDGLFRAPFGKSNRSELWTVVQA